MSRQSFLSGPRVLAGPAATSVGSGGGNGTLRLATCDIEARGRNKVPKHGLQRHYEIGSFGIRRRVVGRLSSIVARRCLGICDGDRNNQSGRDGPTLRTLSLPALLLPLKPVFEQVGAGISAVLGPDRGTHRRFRSPGRFRS